LSGCPEKQNFICCFSGAKPVRQRIGFGIFSRDAAMTGVVFIESDDGFECAKNRRSPGKIPQKP